MRAITAKYNAILNRMLVRLGEKVEAVEGAMATAHFAHGAPDLEHFSPRTAKSEQGQRIFDLIDRAAMLKKNAEVMRAHSEQRESRVVAPGEAALEEVGEEDSEFGRLGLLDVDKFMRYEKTLYPLVEFEEDPVVEVKALPVVRDVAELGAIEEEEEPEIDDFEYTSLEQNFQTPWGQTNLETVREQKEALTNARKGKKSSLLQRTTTPLDDKDILTVDEKATLGSMTAIISMSAHITKRKFWLGSTLPVHLVVKNGTTKVVSAVEVKVIKIITEFEANEEGKVMKVSKRQEILDMSRHMPHGFPVHPRKTFDGVVHIKTPYDTAPSVVLEGYDMEGEEIVYHLHIRPVVGAPKNPTLRLGPFGLCRRL